MGRTLSSSRAHCLHRSLMEARELMQNNFYKSGGGEPLAAVIREVGMGLANVIKSDIALAKAELSDTTNVLKSDLVQIIAFAAVAALGILPFMAFLVIGLGALIGSYWVSSLLVALLCFGVGGGLAYRAMAAMKKHDVSLPHTRGAIELELAAVNRKVKELSAATKTSTEIQDMKGKVA
jgi:hypothetical protein